MDNIWEEVGKAPIWKYKEEKELIGIYISKEENVGQNASDLYNFKRSDGSITAVWGNKILDERLKNIMFGEEVKLVFLGKTKSEKTGREYNNFAVYHKKAE